MFELSSCDARQHSQKVGISPAISFQSSLGAITATPSIEKIWRCCKMNCALKNLQLGPASKGKQESCHRLVERVHAVCVHVEQVYELVCRRKLEARLLAGFLRRLRRNPIKTAEPSAQRGAIHRVSGNGNGQCPFQYAALQHAASQQQLRRWCHTSMMSCLLKGWRSFPPSPAALTPIRMTFTCDTILCEVPLG